MWVTFFTIVIATALCLALGATAIESYLDKVRP
jgi:hypothetical protein